MSRINLFTNPSGRDGTNNYTAINGAVLSVNTDYGFYGPHSIQIVKSAVNDSGLRSVAPIFVTAGLTYSASVYVRLPQALPKMEEANLVIRVEWQNSLGTVVGTDTSATLELASDTTWARLSGVWNAPVGATIAFMQLTQPLGGGDGSIFLADAFLFEQSNYVGGYIDNLSQGQETALVNAALSAPVPQVFNGLQLDADVSINDLFLNTIDEEGALWICTDIDGWWGMSTPESPDIPRGTEDGSYDVSGRYQARVMTLTGVFYPPNIEALSSTRDKLITAINLVRKGGWLRTAENPTKAAFVRLSGRPQIRTINARGKTEFSIGLKAADPIKYHWNDADPEGFSTVEIGADLSVGTAENIGTSEVTAVFTVTGPVGAGTRIYSAASDETLTLVKPLRGRGAVGDIESVSVTNNVVTATTTAPHYLLAGDEINVVGVGSPYDSVPDTYIVTASSNDFPYSFSYSLASDNLSEEIVNGQVQLVNNDVLIIDTYERSVTYNQSTVGHRSKLETLTDWLKLAPGVNIIEFYDDVSPIYIATKSTASGTAKLTSEDIHYLIPGEEITVTLPEEAELSKKSLTDDVATITTTGPHGFSLGDKINVDSTEISIVNEKEASSTEATLTTVDPSGVSVSDVITVSLPASATPNTKSLSSDVATISTPNPHGFSVGDEVEVAFAFEATITNKALTSNQASLTTSAAHNFQVNDSITVTLPTTATIVSKAKVGAQALITTSTAHGFSTGDTISMGFPTSATLANAREISGSAGGYLVQLTTSAPHGFIAGDRVSVNIGISAVAAISNREADATTCTLTSAAHKFSIGEKIVVSGVSARYDGTFYITGVTTDTFTYAFVGSAETSVVSSGTVTNTSISTYYNGSKVIETTPSSTTFTYLAYGQDEATSSTSAGVAATLSNTTNADFSGSRVLVATSATTFRYNT